MSAKNRVSKKEAREMFRTAIEPELRKMNREMVAYRKTQGRRPLAGIASVVAGVAIGAYSGLPPLVSVPLVGAASVPMSLLRNDSRSGILSFNVTFATCNFFVSASCDDRANQLSE